MRITDTHDTAAGHFDYLEETPERTESGQDRVLDEPADDGADLEGLVGASHAAQPSPPGADLRTA